jgi:tRNA (guanine-N7-)-methyltransferase
VVIVDIGCGDGGFLLREAAAHPENEYIGLDVLTPLLNRASPKVPPNVRLLGVDAVEWLAKCARGSIDEVHIYHPQPYYDPSVVGFGMLTASFFARLWLALRRSGILVLQTDNKRYGKYLLEAAALHFEVEVQPGPWPDAPKGRTRRESIAMGKKLPILRVIARRRAVPLDIAPPKPYFVPGTPGLRMRREKRTK